MITNPELGGIVHENGRPHPKMRIKELREGKIICVWTDEEGIEREKEFRGIDLTLEPKH